MNPTNKYNRIIHPIDDTGEPIAVDVYAILVAFDVTCPARQHAIKKLLCAGLRGKGSAHQDLAEARVAIDRALQLLPPSIAKDSKPIEPSRYSDIP